MIKTLKEFGKDYKEYYQCEKCYIRTQGDLEDVVYDLYDLQHADINYDERIIDIW